MDIEKIAVVIIGVALLSVALYNSIGAITLMLYGERDSEYLDACGLDPWGGN